MNQNYEINAVAGQRLLIYIAEEMTLIIAEFMSYLWELFQGVCDMCDKARAAKSGGVLCDWE